MVKETNLSLQPILLGLLMARSGHPYDLHQEFDRELGRIWYIGQSHFYAYLKQLAEAGLATVSTVDQVNRPARNVYQITPEGREVFMTWLHEPTQHARLIRIDLMARLYFFRRLELPGIEKMIADQKALFQTRIDSLARAIPETQDEYWRLILEYRQSEMRAINDWLDHCLETFSK